MINWGASAGYHDAALSVVKNGKIVFAAHAERYSGKKNDKFLNESLIQDALKHGEPERIYWYENPVLKATRRWYAGQDNIWTNPKDFFIGAGYEPPCKIKWGNHHKSHFAAGYYTRPFDECATLVIDAIGEWTTTSIWNNEKMIWSARYPVSLGLFYSAFTDRVGLKPNEDEYILMGMAAYGNPDRFYREIYDMFETQYDRFHKGIRDWRPELKEEDYFDVAAAVQKVFEKRFTRLLEGVREKTNKTKLVFMGGCALNCLANRLIPGYFDEHWIMPNPGDAGSSLGAVLAGTKQKVRFESPYLGHEIHGEYPVEELLQELLTTGIVGVANGKAEFGPRALGNRSLLADPRGQEMKDKVNAIKQRQEFRPFAPVIRQTDAKHYFDVNMFFHSPYMQQVVKCKYPDDYPAIVHKDGTSRVQTVTSVSHPSLYKLLSRWYEETGCPMLLNTSLNIKGEPIVNDRNDAERFEKRYGVKVL
jgi:carbamoyltransferase